MKKIIISLIFLVLFAAVIFILGLVQLVVPAGTWGVMESKISGIDPAVIEGGKWSWTWRWEKVLPTVMTVHIFDPGIYNVQIDNQIKEYIPVPDQVDSAEQIINSAFTFDIYYSIYIDFTIFPQALPGLVKQGVKPEILPGWVMDISEKVRKKCSEFIRTSPDLLFEDTFSSELMDRLSREEELNYLNLLRVIPQKLKLPEYELYLQTRETYYELKNISYEARELKIEQAIEKLNREHESDITELKKDIDILYHTIDRISEAFARYPAIMNSLLDSRQEENNSLSVKPENSPEE